jgi:signal transduction histidine kinase
MSDALEESISELKSANTELLKDNERKSRVDEIRKEFLNNVSHELKTPIALIQGYAEGLREVADDPESRDFYTEVIIDEAEKMNMMVRKLLTLNQLEFGNDPVQLERFDLTVLTKGVISGMQIMIEEAEANVQFYYDAPLPVWGDEFKIEEVLTNYLSNAVHHIDGEKIIEISFDMVDKKHVRVTVFNTGQPIPEADLPHVFEKFYKVDKARTREYGGSGIGLSIVRAIMEGHNQKCGAVNLEQGVAFWFELELCGEESG